MKVSSTLIQILFPLPKGLHSNKILICNVPVILSVHYIYMYVHMQFLKIINGIVLIAFFLRV